MNYYILHILPNDVSQPGPWRFVNPQLFIMQRTQSYISWKNDNIENKLRKNHLHTNLFFS